MRLSLVLGLAVALSTPSTALAFDDPRALVTAIYEPYQAGRQHADIGQFYSTRLQQLFREHASGAGIEVDAADLSGASAIEFDPFIDGQNALLFDVVIGNPLVVGEQALVTVGFHNFDQPTLLSLSLVRESGGWKVDDVTSMGGEENWMLSWLLQYDPWGM